MSYVILEGIMERAIRIPVPVVKIYNLCREAGYEVFLVGGAVRDALMGLTSYDWDFATNATPEQVQALFPDSYYKNEFGMVGVPYEFEGEKRVVEITTYRTDEVYEDFRRPDPAQLKWGKSIDDDLSRRDYTINAIAVGFQSGGEKGELLEKFIVLEAADYEIVDPFGGAEDINKKVIRAVGDPLARFDEDALRMMRAVRFFAQLDFNLDTFTLSAIREKKRNLTRISAERVRDELWKILKSERAYEGVEMLDEVELLPYILPELVAGKGLMQRGHHVHDVFTHSMLALKHCPSKDPLVRFAALLHDIGKVPSHQVRGGINTFFGHDVIGAKMAREIAYRLHLSKKERERLMTLVRWHMFNVDTVQTDAAIRRFIKKVGLENIQDMIDLRIGDRLGSGTKQAEGWRLQEFEKRIEGVLMPTFTVKDLAISGHDVMRILAIPPGPKIGDVLDALFEEVLDDPCKNNREYLERKVREIGVST